MKNLIIKKASQRFHSKTVYIAIHDAIPWQRLLIDLERCFSWLIYCLVLRRFFWVMRVKTSSVNQTVRNPFRLLLWSWSLLRCPTNFLLIIDSKILLMTLSRLMGRYCSIHEHSPPFLETGHTVEMFNGLGKHLSFGQQLNSFASISNSGLMFLKKTTIGILSGPAPLV